MIQLKCPKGHRITGTLEDLSGNALTIGFEKEGGKLVPVHEGETEVWWDGQQTVTRHRVIVVVCSEGDDYRITECSQEEDE